VVALKPELEVVTASTAWRLTAPLRAVFRILPLRLRRALRPSLESLYRALVPHPPNAIDPSGQATPPTPTAGRPTEPVLVLPLGYPVAQSAPAQLAAHLHLYHLELTTELQAYLRNIPCSFALFVSTDTEEKKRRIEKAFASWAHGPVEVRTMPNRGRDIAPKLVGFRDIYERYPLVLFIHSKKSGHRGDLTAWRRFLLDCLLGSRESVAGILEAFERRPDLGIVAPRSFAGIRDHQHWQGNYEISQALGRRMGVSINREDPLEFPAGSMFWARSGALRPLLELNLQLSDFPSEEGQIDGTLAHAIERLFSRVCEAAGFSWIRAGTVLDLAPPEVAIVVRRVSDFDTLWPVKAGA
jgi:lipopolysaccharide biosynthesis protein